jgi:prepilin-type N-terminal cleavage/methylation domain-containing protein
VPVRRRPDEGFTLIEVVVAMAVFTAVSLATLAVVLTSLRTVRENEDRVIAANLARSVFSGLRVAGAADVPLGRTVVQQDGFTVTTDAAWVGVAQTASACDEAAPGADFLRVEVSVDGGTLDSAQVIAGVVPAPEGGPEGPRGSVAVSIGDRFGNPLPDVLVTGDDPFHPNNDFALISGADGCVFLPGLEPTGSLVVSVSGEVKGVSLIAPTPQASQSQAQVVADQVTRLDFTLALPAALRLVGDDTAYPVPADILASWQGSGTGTVATATPLRTRLDGLWPATTGFTAWLGNCSASSPVQYGEQPAVFDLAPGELTTVDLIGARLRAKGLATRGRLDAIYVPIAGDSCNGFTVDVGTADDSGVLDFTLPYGTWEFRSEGQVRRPAALVPSPDRTVVTFDLQPTPSPSPSASPSASPAASGGQP